MMLPNELVWMMEKLGFEWPDIDEDEVRKGAVLVRNLGTDLEDAIQAVDRKMRGQTGPATLGAWNAKKLLNAAVDIAVEQLLNQLLPMAIEPMSEKLPADKLHQVTDDMNDHFDDVVRQIREKDKFDDTVTTRGRNEKITTWDPETGRPVSERGQINEDFGCSDRGDNASDVGNLGERTDDGGHLGAHRFYGDTPDEGIVPARPLTAFPAATCRGCEPIQKELHVPRRHCRSHPCADREHEGRPRRLGVAGDGHRPQRRPDQRNARIRLLARGDDLGGGIAPVGHQARGGRLSRELLQAGAGAAGEDPRAVRS
jgi:hypothetical protein